MKRIRMKNHKGELKELGSFVISRYFVSKIQGKNQIVITHIAALDTDGKYIKFVRKEGVLPYLSQFPVYFKDL